MKRERWTEDEVLNLPSGELDYFDRKSGAILKEPDFLKKLAKALSAFANSGGGHLVLGVKDDGTPDGVPKIHTGKSGKGRGSTKDWLERTIPELLGYPLQDFRVHEVDPSTSTAIPAGNVLIVIDVGDSELAPHQDTFTKIYYHRVSGNSVPAPHLYLEGLRLRAKYPSREIVCAWRDYVISPLLSTLKGQKRMLEQKDWVWNKRELGRGLNVSHIGYGKTYSYNQELFLESYPKIQEAIDRHDKVAIDIVASWVKLFQAIKSEGHLLECLVEATTSQSLQELKAAYHSKFALCHTDEDILQELFGSKSTQEDMLDSIAQHVINTLVNGHTEPKISEPLWNAHQKCFLEVLNHQSISDYCVQLEAIRQDLIGQIESLITLLKNVLFELSKKHGVPPEGKNVQLF
jgi:hypothetical protein